MPQQVDYLIIGQGLAGSVLARKLMQKGLRVVVFDDHQANGASRVAAGMFNPIVFKRLTKTWMSDTALPLSLDFFRAWQAELGLEIVHLLPVTKLFPNKGAANDFAARSAAPEFEHTLSTDPHADGDALEPTFGYGTVAGGGYVELGHLLDEVRQRWLKEGIVQHEVWDESALVLGPNGVSYKGYEAKGAVVCTGHQLLDSPLFGYLPILRTQGEVLEVTSPRTYKGIVNNGRWSIPIGPGRFRIGSTYVWHINDPSPTQKGKDELLSKLEPVLGDMSVVNHKGGIRPAVSDRRPLLGTHPKQNKLHVFGGLGTRGVMIAPMCADWMVDHLLDNKALPADADIFRFAKLLDLH